MNIPWLHIRRNALKHTRPYSNTASLSGLPFISNELKTYILASSLMTFTLWKLEIDLNYLLYLSNEAIRNCKGYYTLTRKKLK